jgi:ubiquinone/menaquinone biosynthesis C-methylase UbiE
MSVLREIPDHGCKSIFSSHFLEHVDETENLLRECLRCLVPGGRMHMIVPHFSNPFFYSDPTHKKFFGLYSFSYFFACRLFSRAVPAYTRIPGGELVKVSLVFRSYKPHYLSHLVRKLLQLVVNIRPCLMEVYEENLTGIISCYQVEYVVLKVGE